MISTEARALVEALAEDGVVGERWRRDEMWHRLLKAGGPRGVQPRLLRDLGIYGGAQGIWVDKQRTIAAVSGTGAAVGLLHTGLAYADDLADDGVIYHYPSTNRRGKDEAEIAALKAAGECRLPVFVIIYSTPGAARRDVRLGWVEGADDRAQQFLVTFGERPPPPLKDPDIEPFKLVDRTPAPTIVVKTRPGQKRFQFRVIERYGSQCAVCGLAVPELLEAAHIRSKRDRGSDDPRNGLVLCATHHRAFDAHFFAVDPHNGEICSKSDGPTLEALLIRRTSLRHLAKQPHQEALAWRWAQWDG